MEGDEWWMCGLEELLESFEVEIDRAEYLGLS